MNVIVIDNIYNKKACIALGKDAHGHSNAHWTLSALQVSIFTQMFNINNDNNNKNNDNNNIDFNSLIKLF